MAMFGAGLGQMAGAKDFLKRPMQEPQMQMAATPQAPLMPQPMGMAPMATMPEPPKFTTLQKVGLIGDVLTGRNVTGARLQDEMQQRAMQARQYQPQQIGDSIVRLNPQTGIYEAVYSAPQKAPSPYRFSSNDGDVYEIGADGQPKRLFDDPTPKMNFIPDGMGGGQWVSVPTAAPSMPMPTAMPKPVGKLTPVMGGAPSQGGATFP